MIGKLFSQRFLSLFAVLLALGSGIVNAQTTVLTTGPATNIVLVRGAATGPHPNVAARFISFEVRNDNLCPIGLTNVAIFHPGAVAFTGFTVSANDSTYVLYSSTSNLTNNPIPITAANGWTTVATSAPINTGTTNGIAPIFGGLDVTIPANSTMRFILECKDTMLMHVDRTPLSFTSNGITLTAGSQTQTWGGWAPGVNANSAFNALGFTTPFNSINFVGSLTLVQKPPTTPVADIALKPAYRCLNPKSSVILKATHPKPGGLFTWRNAAGTIISQNTTGTDTLDNLTLADAGRYYVTYTLCGLESARDSITVIINNPPAPTISGKLDYCLNEQFEYTVVNGTNPKWYYTDFGGSPVPVIPTINTSTPNTLVYYVSQTDAYGCESIERTLVRYRAAAKPTPPIVNTPVYYCEEAAADQLTAIGDTLRWYYFAQGGIPTEIAPTPNTSVNTSFKYYVTQTIDGCESDRRLIDVHVVFKPNGVILLDKEQMCARDTITVNYYGSAFVGSQYNWTLPNKGAVLLNGGFDQGPLVMRLDSAGKYQIQLRVGNTGCLSDLYTEEILVNPLPYGRISFKQDVCLGQPELMESLDYTPGLDTFIWDFAGGKTTHFTTDQGPYGVYWETPGEKIINVTFIDEGCIDKAIDTIMVHPRPNAKIVGTYQLFADRQFKDYDYKPGDEMCASDSLKVSVEKVEPGATYKWTPSRFFDKYSDLPVTYARVDFDSKIYVEVEDVYGCQNKDSLEILTKSCCEMVFPSAFTPNNDGKNDVFRPITVGRREVRTFKVMNRYGQIIYESRQAGIGWDGTMNGKPADVGTYFFLISFMCEKESVDQGGEVILMR